jgi:hypothetical protein
MGVTGLFGFAIPATALPNNAAGSNAGTAPSCLEVPESRIVSARDPELDQCNQNATQMSLATLREILKSSVVADVIHREFNDARTSIHWTSG